MVKDCSTPMLRAYNADAGNCVHGGLSMNGAFDRLRRYSHNHLR